jgi:hypothetical protein
MRFKAGDRIEVTSNSLGIAPRQGAVLESTNAGGIRVQWDDGHESMYVPGSNCRVIAPSAGDIATVRLGCHIEVTIVEDDHQCVATAKVITSTGVMKGEGVARLKPGDARVPRIGEELALGRALKDLSEHLLAMAGDDIAEHRASEGHLVN